MTATNQPSLQDNAPLGQLQMATQPDQIQPTQPAPSTQPAAPGTQPVVSPGPPVAQPGQMPPAPPATTGTKKATHQALVSGLFDKILQHLAPMPLQDAQGNSIRQTHGAIGRSILAGAVSGMLAGAATPTTPGAFGPRTNWGGALEKGANAAQENRQKQQQTLDDNQARKINSFSNALKLHAQVVNAQEGDLKLQQVHTDLAKPLIQGLMNWDSSGPHFDTDGKTPVKGLIDQGMTWDALNKKYGNNLLANYYLNDGWTPVIDPKTGKQYKDEAGVPQFEPTFAVANPKALVSLENNPDLRKQMEEHDNKWTRVPEGGTMRIQTALDSYYARGATKNAEYTLTHFDENYESLMGTKKENPTTLASLRQEDALTSKMVATLGAYADKSVDEAADDLLKSGDPEKVRLGTILSKAYNLDDTAFKNKATLRLQEQKDAEAVEREKLIKGAIANTPQGQAELTGKLLDNQKKQQDIAQADAQAKGVVIPPNFTPSPRAPEMESTELQANLAKQGVEIPGNFAALYAIAHNAADLTTLPTSPRRGVNVMPQVQGLAYIKTFINPLYNEGDYTAAKKFNVELASTRVGQAGGTLLSAGTASNHLDMLEKAGEALHNQDLVALNKIALFVKAQTGQEAPVVFQAIAEQVNSEVSKVVAGGQPNEPELKANRETLRRDQSPQQIKGVISAYIGLMNGRIGEIDQRSVQYFGRHVMVSPSTSTVFNRYGFQVPGQRQGELPYYGPDGKLMGFTDGKGLRRVRYN